MSTISPDVTSCVIQPTSDQQLNYNLAELVKLLIASLQDGTIAVKNSERIQNLTIDDIIELAKKAMPNQDINNYITENGTNIIEMIDSYSIVRDTKFVNSNFIPFKVITRLETDPNDPTGLTQIDVPYIQAKLPYDIINKDRIVQIYITTKNDTNVNNIENDVIFEYYLDIDPTDPRAAYIMEARAQKIVLGKTELYDVSSYPNDPSWWGTWSKEKYIVVSYLVDTNWVSIPTPDLPSTTTPNVAITTSSNVIPMNYGLGNLSLTDRPTEAVNVLQEPVKIVGVTKSNFDFQETVNVLNDPALMIIEDPAQAKQFDEYLNWFINAAMVIEQRSHVFNWTPDGTNHELVNILVMPNNKIINQATYNLMAKSYMNWGKSIGLSAKIIEIVTSNPIELKVSSKFEPQGTIDGTESPYSLMVKFMAGEQYNFINVEKFYLPARIVEIITTKQYARAYALNRHFPARIIEEIKTFLNPIRFDEMVTYLPIPSRVINWLGSLVIPTQRSTKKMNFPSRIIEETNNTIADIKNGAPDTVELELIQTGAKVINQLQNELILSDQIRSVNHLNLPAHIINQIDVELQDAIDIYNNKRDFGASTSSGTTILSFIPDLIQLKKVFLFNPTRIINQESLYPMKMEVHSGTINYIQDLYNMRVVTSLNKLEMVPLITAEGRQQRSEYEFVAEQDQRVFTVEHNPDLVTVFRQGFKLSHGDYYTNGYNIILKSPANAGEIINVVSERKYVFANTVTKEELDNAIAQFKTDRPIITYPGLCYEKSSAEIKINNYDPSASYTVSIKYEGTYRDDIPWVKRNDTIVVDIPEVNIVTKRTISVIIWAGTSGRLQSQPTEANITIKNLYDSDDNPYRLIFGAIPTNWYGMENTKYTFEEMRSPATVFSELSAVTSPYPVPDRIGIAKDKWYQSKLVAIEKFKGTFIEAAIGLENLPNRGLNIISSNGNETVFSCDRTQDEIEKAFENGTLYFIVDASTAPNDSNYQIPSGPGYDNQRYSYRQALEYTPVLNLLPRTDADSSSNTDATWYLEHNNKLRGRNIHAAIILDFSLMVDYDFDGQAIITEDNTLSQRNIPMESVEYKVQDEIPHIVVKINDPSIPNITNPYINIGSKIKIETGNQTLDDFQKDTLLVNNLYAERIFSGLHTSLIPKDNFTDTQAIMNTSKRYKKFVMYSPGGLFETHYKKDMFMLNEEDFSDSNNQNKSIITMGRFFSDSNMALDNPTYSARLKELIKFAAIPDSFKALYPIASEDFSSGSDYQANFGHVQYGGTADYVIDTAGTTANVIEQKITTQKLYIKNSENITSGAVPFSNVQATDGYHVLTKSAITRRIPTWWDVVLRPSVRAARMNSLRSIWFLIRDSIPITDGAWLKITDGILCKPKALTQDNLNEGIHKDYDTGSIPDKSQIFLFGGEGYKPTRVRKKSVSVDGTFVTGSINDGEYYAANLKWAYNKRYAEQGHYAQQVVTNPDGTTSTQNVWVDDGGWKEKTDIIDIAYGWENGEPYVEYAWADHYYWYGRNGEQYSEIKFYIDRVSRTKIVNKDIYHLDLAIMDTYNPGDNDIFPSFITKITSSDYSEIYNHPDPTNTSTITKFAGTTADSRPNFIDIQFESGAWWLTIKPAFTNHTKLYRMKVQYTNLAAINGNIQVTSFSWKEMKDLHTDANGQVQDPNFSRWTLLPDITGTLRGDGPILIKHSEKSPFAGTSTATVEPGIYTFDTWDKHLYKKSPEPTPMTSLLFGIGEVVGVRNPYIMLFDYTGIEDKIDIVGSRIYVIIYLDKFLSQLTKEQFYQFKEELLHINNNASTVNPNKMITVLSNIIKIGIRTILPDGDDYRATSAQILMDRVTTQTGRQATSLVFRLVNNDTKVLEIDSVRFQSL